MIKEAIDEVKLRIKLDSFILILSINEYKDSPELILPQSLKKGIYGIHLYHICIFLNKISGYKGKFRRFKLEVQLFFEKR